MCASTHILFKIFVSTGAVSIYFERDVGGSLLYRIVGHGFCENAINEMKRHDRIGVCPTCRSDIRGEEPTRLYIKFIDLTSSSDALTKQVASVANCLANLDTTPTIDMVEDAGMMLGRIRRSSSDNNDELSQVVLRHYVVDLPQ